MKTVSTVKYDLYNYFDVWGNEEDGWEVNNLCVEKRNIEMTDDCSDKDIISWLYWNEFVTTEDVEKFEIECMGEFIEIFEKETMKPLYSLRPVY